MVRPSLVLVLLLVPALAGCLQPQGADDDAEPAPAGPGAADPAPQPSPYAGQEARAVKALSGEEVADLLEGRGMGLAKAAELNRHPGPLHVLELADELGLTPEQREATERIRADMLAEARRLGAEVVALERDLDALFAQGDVDEARLDALTAAIGVRMGALRAEHLRAHVALREALTHEQVMRYDELRGYASHGDGGGDGAHDGGHAGHDAQGH